MRNGEQEEEAAPMVGVIVEMRGRKENLALDQVAIPRPWVDELAFTGSGFTITVSLPQDMNLEKGSTIRVQVGRVRKTEEETFPPFDPPYASNAKRSDPPA